jgi:hypothetical protein
MTVEGKYGDDTVVPAVDPKTSAPTDALGLAPGHLQLAAAEAAPVDGDQAVAPQQALLDPEDFDLDQTEEDPESPAAPLPSSDRADPANESQPDSSSFSAGPVSLETGVRSHS